jgi:hypothetical protein
VEERGDRDAYATEPLHAEKAAIRNRLLQTLAQAQSGAGDSVWGECTCGGGGGGGRGGGGGGGGGSSIARRRRQCGATSCSAAAAAAAATAAAAPRRRRRRRSTSWLRGSGGGDGDGGNSCGSSCGGVGGGGYTAQRRRLLRAVCPYARHESAVRHESILLLCGRPVGGAGSASGGTVTAVHSTGVK